MSERNEKNRPHRYSVAGCLLPIVVLGCVPHTLVAAELVVRDLDISLSVLPTAFSYTLTSPTVTGSGNDSFTSGTELAFGGRYALGRPGDALGLVIGGAVISDTWTYGSNGQLFANGLRVSAGLGWALSDNWTLLVEPGYRYGISTFNSAASATATDYTATGTYSGYEARVAALWQISKGLLVEGHSGWLSLQHAITSDSIDQTIDQSGMYVGIGVVWRWSTAPPLIE